MQHESNISTKKCVVAFLDVLGTKEAIKADENGSLNIIHQCYEYASKEMAKRYTTMFSAPDIKIFSDNIVLSIPCDDLDEDEQSYSIFSMIAFCSLVLIYFWNCGLLIRGGISIGTYFSDELMVWGEGLVRTALLENQVAIYPRIIVDPKDKRTFETACEPFDNFFINEDFDGVCFVDPILCKNKKHYKEMLIKLLDKNIKLLKKNRNKDVKVEQKLLWFNKYIREKIAIIEDEERYRG